jgi:hypothetical protein
VSGGPLGIFVSFGGGTFVNFAGGTFVSFAGGTFVGSFAGGTFVSFGGGTFVSFVGGTFVSFAGGTFVSLAGGTFVSFVGGTFVNFGGGTFVSFAGGTFVSFAGGTFVGSFLVAIEQSLSLSLGECINHKIVRPPPTCGQDLEELKMLYRPNCGWCQYFITLTAPLRVFCCREAGIASAHVGGRCLPRHFTIDKTVYRPDGVMDCARGFLLNQSATTKE